MDSHEYKLLDELLKQTPDPSSQYKLNYGDNFCPICDNHTLEYGERVDFSQVTPHTCDFCGYRQPKDKQEFEQMEVVLAKCWELQIDYWGRDWRDAT